MSRTDGQTDGQTDRQTDGQTDRITISISRVSSSMLTRDKNRLQTTEYGRMAVLGNRIWYVKYVLSYFVEGNLTGKQICCYRFYNTR